MESVSPLTIDFRSRDPDLAFKDVQLNPYEAPIASSGGATLLGTVAATATIEGCAPTQMHYRVVQVGEHILLGQRCGFLHSPHLNARNSASETLWCTNCWADLIGLGRGTLIVPFYLYYRHYDDHILGHLPACACGKQFQIWEPELPLKDTYAYLFSAYQHQALQGQVEALLSKASHSS